MTTTEERVLVEVAAEVKRIEVWNQSQGPALTSEEVWSLSNHLVRNRLQVEMGMAELRTLALQTVMGEERAALTARAMRGEVQDDGMNP